MAFTTKQIAEAIYTINRHAKTAPKPKHLYDLKKQAIDKLLKEKRATKKGLHFSDKPKLSNQHSTLLVQVECFYFHILPMKKDLKALKHLGSLDQSIRNPQVKMSLSKAKKIIYVYLNLSKKQHNTSHYTPYNYGEPAVLGKFSWEANTHLTYKNRPKR